MLYCVAMLVLLHLVADVGWCCTMCLVADVGGGGCTMCVAVSCC